MRNNIKRFIRSAIFWDLVFLFLLSLTPLLWFRGSSILFGHDNVFPLQPSVFLLGRLATWSEQAFGQNQTMIMGSIPIHIIDALPFVFGFSLQATQKIVYIFWFFSIGVSAYILAKTLHPENRYHALIAAILYQFNFFILQGWWIGERTKFSAYIALPLIIAWFLRVVNGSWSPLVAGIIIGLTLFVFNGGGLFGIPLFGGAIITIGAFLLFFVVSLLFQRKYRDVSRLGLTVLCAGVATLVLYAYYIMPSAVGLLRQFNQGVASHGGSSGLIEWASEISANASYMNIMRLQGIPEWYDNPEHPYAKFFLTNPWLIAASFLWPILVLFALRLKRESKETRWILYLFFVYLLGIFFTAGTHPPLGFLYAIFIQYIPGFGIFRSPYFKFAPAVFFSSSFLIASLFTGIWNRKWRIGVFICLLGFIFVYHFPYFTGEFFSWRKGFSTRLVVPSYIFQFGEWLNQQSSDTRVLLLPPDSPDLQYGLYKWGYLSFQALPTLLSNGSVVVNNDKLDANERTLTMELYDSLLKADTHRAGTLMQILGITHVVVQHDADTNVKSSIPLDAALYAQGLLQTNLFALEKRFGMWDVYRKKSDVSGRFSLLSDISVVDGDFENANLFVDSLDVPGDFILKDEANDPSVPVNKRIVVPMCLTCPKNNKPAVVFPERNILPGDPLYAVVLLLENRHPLPKDPKAAIYNALGQSLKRVSEMNELMSQKSALPQDLVERYVALFTIIKENFNRLTSLEDKIKVAGDLSQYIRSERNFLRPNIERSLPGGLQTILAGRVFSVLYNTNKVLEPYTLSLEDQNTRLYQFTLAADDVFQVSVRRDELVPYLTSKDSVHITIDDTTVLEPQVSKAEHAAWVPFGDIKLEKGFHTLKLTLPSPIESTYLLHPIETEFSVKGENSCFGAVVSHISSEKLYKMQLKYTNDFSDNLIILVWEHDQGKARLMSAVKLLTSALGEKQEQLLGVSQNVSELTIALCAPNMTQERADKLFTIGLSEVVYPSALLTTTNTSVSSIHQVSYTHSSPTSYSVSLAKDMKYPALLVFSDQFDPLWEIRGVNARHIHVNGYANGWIIDTPIDKPISIEYKGQTYFLWGVAISLTALCLELLLLIKKLKN